jgi:3-hydroxybutyryl-CoA dehydrogenase
MSAIQTIAVCGAGTMGAGIAAVFAQAGFVTILFDIDEEQLKKAEQSIFQSLSTQVQKNKISQQEMVDALSRIGYTDAVRSVEANIIIEAIVEKLQPKVELFKTLADVNEPTTILATNTSSIPVTRIAVNIPQPERVVGMHFFNPAGIMKLVEVISGAATATQVAQTVFNLAKQLGKVPVMVKDAPGFIVNRVARHYYVEALKLLEENVSSVENIDALMESSGFKMGPFRLMDLIGVDTNFSVTHAMYESFHYDAKFRPSRIQQQKVDAGHKGKKTKQGFYPYS